MFCQQCGNEIKGNEQFCAQCGARLQKESKIKIEKSQKKGFVDLGEGLLTGLRISVIMGASVLGVLILVFAILIGGTDGDKKGKIEAVIEITERQGFKKTQEEYILPDSASAYISQADLSQLTAEECRLARNEIYARHGRKFKDEKLQAYFDSKSWYRGTIEADAFKESDLNDYEKKNKDVILAYEKSKGYR